MSHGLEKRAPQQSQEFHASKSAAIREEMAAKAAREKERSETLKEFESTYRPALHQGFLDSLARSFPYVALLSSTYTLPTRSPLSGLDMGVSDVEAAEKNRRE
jgi:hypothetical protein